MTKTIFPTIRDKRVFKLQESDMSVPVGISETIPDDTLSIKEILAKHVRGMRIEDQEMRRPLYDDNVNFDSEDLGALARLDLADRHEYAEMLRARIESDKVKIQQAEEALRKKSARDKNTEGVTSGETSPGSDPDGDGHTVEAPDRGTRKATKERSGNEGKRSAVSGSPSGADGGQKH